MNKNTIRNYKSKWGIDIFDKHQLSYEDVLKILKIRNPEINFDNKKFIDGLISGFPKNFPNVHKIRIYLGQIFNPSGTPQQSRLQKDFWILRGWTGEEDHIQKFKKSHARKSSIRCKEYWINKGYSEVEQELKVKEIQSSFGSRVDYQTRVVQSWRRKEYWINKGYSETEAELVISDLQQKYANMQNRGNYPEEIRRTWQFHYDEYWMKRFPENWSQKREEFFKTWRQGQIQQKWATELILWILDNFYKTERDHLSYLDNEFGRYIQNVGYRRWDFVDTKNKFVIEFNGYYYHKQEYAQKNDKIKKDYMINLGYSYLTVWDDYFYADRQFTNEYIQEFINENKKY